MTTREKLIVSQQAAGLPLFSKGLLSVKLRLERILRRPWKLALLLGWRWVYKCTYNVGVCFDPSGRVTLPPCKKALSEKNLRKMLGRMCMNITGYVNGKNTSRKPWEIWHKCEIASVEDRIFSLTLLHFVLVVECLLEVLRSKNLRLEKNCKKLIRKRMDLWSAVDVVSTLRYSFIFLLAEFFSVSLQLLLLFILCRKSPVQLASYFPGFF